MCNKKPLNMNKVKEYYNDHIYFEDKRLEWNELEIPVTMKYIEKYTFPGQKIFDVACGTGKYSKILLEKGYKLGINDLSDQNIKLSGKRLGDHQNLIHTSISDALDLKIPEKGTWDAVLVLGPLYHMTHPRNRLKMLQKASEFVKKKGYVFAAFMTRTAALIYGLKNNPEGILKANGVRKLWKNGHDRNFVESTEWFTNAYFSHPEEIFPLIREAGLKPLHLAGIEGVFGENMNLFHALEKNLQKKWTEFIMTHCEDIHMVNNSKHLLCVARKE